MADIDWTASMQQTYEFYKVDSGTWMNEKLLETITECSIDFDSSEDTLGSATLSSTEPLDECYVRIYLVAIQNGYTFRFPLGTFMAQTPSVSFDGKNTSVSMDCYTPLIELKGEMPEIGYTVYSGTTIMELVSELCAEHMRAPVIASSDTTIIQEDFVADTDDTWLTFITDFMANANFSFSLDDMGRVLFSPYQKTIAMQPVWEYTDDNSSILYPDVEDEQDIFDMPNVVQVIYTSSEKYIYAEAVNDDPSSPISTVFRGRRIVYRETDPTVPSVPTQDYLDDYAADLLESLSSLEHTITYKHGYNGVRVGDCVMLNYKRAGISGIKAKVTSQSISCEDGCPVDETATYVTQLWENE